uniref:BTB domain-containing protein n=1 Tax=Clytia hemisphaerica TaxID=252671 RepID=A0A7M5U749_9CNID
MEIHNRHKRFIRFGTIRRKLAKSLKTGKHSDYRKHMRELLQKWPVKEIQDLLRQYEGLEAIKKLSILSDAAQPEISSLESDILSVLDNNVCTDLVIDYNGHLYSLHKGIVSCRCKFFAKYLSAFKQDNDVIKFEIPGLVLDEQTFSSLLRYIYTGQIYDYQLDGVLSELADKFGTLNELTHDLKTLLDSENHTDVVLVYLQEPRKTHNAPSFVSAFAGQSSLDTKLEVRCHSALLCARSVFFRSLIKRKLGRTSKHERRLSYNNKRENPTAVFCTSCFNLYLHK